MRNRVMASTSTSRPTWTHPAPLCLRLPSRRVSPAPRLLRRSDVPKGRRLGASEARLDEDRAEAEAEANRVTGPSPRPRGHPGEDDLRASSPPSTFPSSAEGIRSSLA